jgi:hypothetical protein
MRQEGRRAGAPACPLGGRPQTAQPSPRTPTSFLLCRSCCPSCCCPCCSGGRQAAQPDGCRVLRQGVCAVCQRHPEQHRGCAALLLRCAVCCLPAGRATSADHLSLCSACAFARACQDHCPQCLLAAARCLPARRCLTRPCPLPACLPPPSLQAPPRTSASSSREWTAPSSAPSSST